MTFIPSKDCTDELRIAQIALDEASAVQPGHYVQVCLSDHLGRPGERFWVRVTGVHGTTYTGVVSNHLSESDLAYGDLVTFGVGHILAAMNDIKREYQLRSDVTDAEVCQELGQRLLYLWQCQERGHAIDGERVVDLVTEIFGAFGHFEEYPHESS